jgi:transposase
LRGAHLLLAFPIIFQRSKTGNYRSLWKSALTLARNYDDVAHSLRVSLHPEQTVRVARAAFPRGNLYLKMRDELGAIFTDEDFAALFPKRGQWPKLLGGWRWSPSCSTSSGLSDRQTADSVRSRIDWKYALSLELNDPGFDSTVLCEFRARLVAGSVEQKLLDALLEKCRERKLVKARGRQRTDSTHVLARVRAVNRLECVGETMRHALNSLAVVAPDWLQAHSRSEWVERYGRRVDDYHLPTNKGERHAYVEVIGADGW